MACILPPNDHNDHLGHIDYSDGHDHDHCVNDNCHDL
jgi:hypothetical protein